MSAQKLYLFVGYPGAGKTTVAQVIAEATGAVHLWADKERQEMFGTPTHSADESAQLYDHLNQKTAELLAAGKSVIFDTNFNFRKDRENLRQLATEHGADTVLIWMKTPVGLARERATTESENQDTRVLGTMAGEDFERISGHLQAPTDDERPILLDGTDLDMDEVRQKLGL